MANRSAEPDARGRTRRWVMRAQGVYYVALGVWPIAHFASYAAAVGLRTTPFHAHLLSAVFVVLGACLLEATRKEAPGVFPTLVGVAVASAVAFVELIWLPRSRVIGVLWADLGLQLAFTISLLLLYPRAQESPGRPGVRRRHR